VVEPRLERVLEPSVEQVMQLALELKAAAAAGTVHKGPVMDDEDHTGCDCCAQRLRCGKCGARYLARLYAYFYRYDTADEDGYMVGMNGTFGDLPGPCCLEEDPAGFAVAEENDGWGETLVRHGQRVLGGWGVLEGRIWIPKTWPTGDSPWAK